MTDTIHALATAPGKAAVAIVRISGPASATILKSLTGRSPSPRRASLRTLRAPDGELLDTALVLWLPGPASFTGEDGAELHLHGGRAVIAAALHALAKLGSRPAEPGEFTRRAFEHGKLDLTEAEAVADLVDAENDAQRRQALDQLGGATTAKAAAWRRRLTTALAYLEAAVDFPDENLPEDVAQRARPGLLRLRDELAAAAADRRGEHVREGLRITLIGAPNAGKSSLLNALSGRPAAIVTDIPGTTRDIIETRIELAGMACTLADTAGLRASDDVIEAEGVRRALDYAARSDLRLWVVDAAAAPPEPPAILQPADWMILAQTDRTVADLEFASRGAGDRIVVKTSVVSAGGVQELQQRLQAWAAEMVGGREPPVVTRARHRDRLVAAVAHLERAVYAGPLSPELLAEDVRLATRELERLTGSIDAETVLGEVFSTFCIGK